MADLSAPGNTLWWELYSDSGFTSQVPGDTCNDWNSTGSLAGDIRCAAPNLSAGTYYLKVSNYYSFQSTAYSIIVAPDVPGYAGATPASLGLDTHVTGTIIDNELQYYSFTPPASGTYTMTVTSPINLTWDLYSDPACATLLKHCDYSSYSDTAQCMTNNLPRAAHYVKITNNDSASGQYDILVTGQNGSEGAIGDPVVLTSRTPYTAGRLARAGTSYYKFQAEALANPAPYLIMITGEQPSTDVVGWKLFSDPTFSTKIGECFLRTFSGEIVCSTGEISPPQALTPGAYYYVTVQNGSSYSASITCTVTVTPLSSESGCSAGGTCYNFEAATAGASIPSPFAAEMYSDANWNVTTGDAGSGTKSVQSGISNKNQDLSCFQITATDVKWMTYSVKTQFATDTNSLGLYIDFGPISIAPDQSWTGTNAWQRVIYRPQFGGSFKYEWCHKKNDTLYIDNNAWIDDIELNY